MSDSNINFGDIHKDYKDPDTVTYTDNPLSVNKKIDYIPPSTDSLNHIVLISKDGSNANIVYINKGDNKYTKYTKNGDNYNDDKKTYVIKLEESIGGGGGGKKKTRRNRKKKTRPTKTNRKLNV